MYGKSTLKLAKHLSNSTQFEFGFRIISQQLEAAARAWFSKSISDRPDYSGVRAFHDDPHSWSPWLDFSVDALRAPPFTPGQIRFERERMLEVLSPIYEGWRNNPRSFGEVRAAEAAAFGPTTLRRAARDAEAPPGSVEHLFGTEAMDNVDSARRALIKAGCPVSDSLDTTNHFFMSDAAALIPNNVIRSRLFAHESHMIKHGMKRPHSSALSDINRLSTLLPYCDAVLIENHFAAALTERNMLLPPEARRCKVFAVRQLDDFVRYLDTLYSRCPATRIARARYFYGRPPSVHDISTLS
jgi:hypothetical protein